MGKKGTVKKVFPGGNTPQGFYSFYDNIVTHDATRLIIIKGGPGVGKSTFMKRIAESMVDMGYDVELHHCSSDNNSLDGVVIPRIGVALIDGTAPHIVDPKWPGAVDEIIHLGDYWDERKLRGFRNQIIAANKEISRHFERAYRYLRGAKAVYDDLEVINMDAMDYGKANKIAEDIMWDIFRLEKVSLRLGRERHLFASEITPDGMVNYLDTIVGPCHKKYIIKGNPGTGKSVLLTKIARAGLERGYDVEMYHCPLNPEKVEHVLLPEMGVALTKSIEPHTYTPAPYDVIINMNECLDSDILSRNAATAAEDERLFDELFNKAIHSISMAKTVHDELETYYVPCMDFDGIEHLREEILQRIQGYADEQKVRAG